MDLLAPLLKSKRAVTHGALFIFLILLLIVDFPTHKDTDDNLVVVEKDLDITKDIIDNPFLQNRELWKVKQVFLTGEEDLTKNETLNSLEALEILLENSFVVGKETTPIVLDLMPLPEVEPRSELSIFEVKSTAEKKLIEASKSKIHMHIVQAGETIWDISKMYGIDVQTIIASNYEISNIGQLQVGQELRILNTKGVVHKLVPYETLSDVAQLYKVSLTKIQEYNRASRLRPGDTIIVPGASPTGLACRSGYSTGYIWPTTGRLSSGFGARWGRMHYGLDIAVPTGTPVLAAKSGKVILAGWATGYGYAIYIKHDDNTVTRYGHNSKLLVKKDDFVYQGERIALSGDTGVSTGPHVHFEIRIKGKAVNPRTYLK